MSSHYSRARPATGGKSYSHTSAEAQLDQDVENLNCYIEEEKGFVNIYVDKLWKRLEREKKRKCTWCNEGGSSTERRLHIDSDEDGDDGQDDDNGSGQVQRRKRIKKNATRRGNRNADASVDPGGYTSASDLRSSGSRIERPVSVA